MNAKLARLLPCGVALSLAVLVAVVFWPVHRYDYVTYDDPEYVTGNRIVQEGLTWAGVRWAFTTGWTSYWHPLTWLSHILDAELFGPGPAGPHVVNAAIHLLNTLLVLALLRSLTGSLWRAGWVAAVFALHPLHVESVAWVSERKDVLSACFYLSALIAYAHYARRADRGERARGWYGATLLSFVLGLMSKPMVVTLPCVLLLLDYWPLGRFVAAGAAAGRTRWLRLVGEKIPFFALTAACNVATFLVQRQNGAVHSLESLPVVARLQNALVAYATYLERTFWPADLAVFYPHPGEWGSARVLTAALVFLGASALLLGLARRHRFATTGWLWFAGMLVPTIGLVQVGDQAMADRYTYVPMIGVLIVAAWSAHAWLPRRPVLRATVAFAGMLAVAACAWRTSIQLKHWRNSEALFRHAIAVTDENFVAHNNLGNLLLEQGDPEGAIAQYRETLRIRPDYAPPHNNLGLALLNLGRVEEAIPHFRRALEAQPGFAEVHHNLGDALRRNGELDEAARHYARAIELRPALAVAHARLGSLLAQRGEHERALAALQRALEIEPADALARGELGLAYLQTGRLDEARVHLENALQLRPDLAETRYHLAIVLLQGGRLEEAIPHFERVVEQFPDDAEVQNNLGWVYLRVGRLDDAVHRIESALRVAPDFSLARRNLAMAFLRQGRAPKAIAAYEALLSLEPGHLSALSDLAWVLATWPDATVRNSRRALELAQHANRLSGGQDPMVLRSLAAALAESGQFGDAAATARQALALANAAENLALGEVLRGQIRTYEAGSPLREAPPKI